jgi:hypothetical protein
MKLLFGFFLAILLLPFAVLLLPLLLFRVFFGLFGLVLKAVFGLVVLPIVFLVGLIVLAVGTVAFWLAILSPLIPFALLACAIWAVVKLASHPRYV